MSCSEWLGGLLILLGAGGIVIVFAELLCGWLKLDRKRAEPEEFQDTDAIAQADALFARIDAEIRAEAAQIAKQCEVRR
jgi:predicted nucleic acid-binding protein